MTVRLARGGEWGQRDLLETPDLRGHEVFQVGEGSMECLGLGEWLATMENLDGKETVVHLDQGVHQVLADPRELPGTEERQEHLEPMVCRDSTVPTVNQGETVNQECRGALEREAQLAL